MKSKVSYYESEIREIMYGFSMEEIKGEYPKKLKLSIPELGGTSFEPTVAPMPIGSNIFINDVAPQVSKQFNSVNYIELPFMITGLNMNEMNHKETEHSHSCPDGGTSANKAPVEPKHYNDTINIKKGDRFILLFPNKNISNGVILGKG